MKSSYIVMRGGKVLRLDGETRRLGVVENKQPATLFESYDSARNAVRRTVNSFKKLPTKAPMVSTHDYMIVPVEGE